MTEQIGEPAATPGAGAPRILVMCTANICRSPLAEALLHRSLRDLGVEATVTSAGVRAVHRAPDPRSVAYAQRHGVDLHGHQARQLDRTILATDGADLVIGMTREHVREAVVLDATVIGRAFTIRELARRAATVDRLPGEELGAWIARLGSGRRAIDLLGEAAADDVPDPFGRSDAMFAEVAHELDELCERIARDLAAIAREHH